MRGRQRNRDTRYGALPGVLDGKSNPTSVAFQDSLIDAHFVTYRRSVRQGCYCAGHSDRTNPSVAPQHRPMECGSVLTNLDHLRDGDAKGGSGKCPHAQGLCPGKSLFCRIGPNTTVFRNQEPKISIARLISQADPHSMDRLLKPGFVAGSPPRTTMLLDLKNLKCSACDAIFIYAPLAPRGSGLPFYCPECGACAINAT